MKLDFVPATQKTERLNRAAGTHVRAAVLIGDKALRAGSLDHF
jgi:hypothetical protein